MTNSPKNPFSNTDSQTSDSERMGRQSASSETVSQRKKDLAKGRMDKAFRLKIAGDTDGARASLADAVRTDPSLISDSAAVGLAQALTGLPRDQAILSLLQTSGDAQPIESSRPVFKFTTQQFDTFLYIFALFIVLLLFSGAMYVGIAQLVNIFMSRAELSPKLASQMNVLLDQIKPAELVRATLQTGVEWLFDILLGIGAIYMIGTMMGGVGAIGAFTRKMARAYIILYVLLSVGLLFLFGSLSQLSSTNNPTNANPLSALGLAIIVITGISGLFGLAWVAARAHEMNYFKGMAALMIGNFVVVILAGLLGLFSQSGPTSTTPDFPSSLLNSLASNSLGSPASDLGFHGTGINGTMVAIPPYMLTPFVITPYYMSEQPTSTSPPYAPNIPLIPDMPVGPLP